MSGFSSIAGRPPHCPLYGLENSANVVVAVIVTKILGVVCACFVKQTDPTAFLTEADDDTSTVMTSGHDVVGSDAGQMVGWEIWKDD